VVQAKTGNITQHEDKKYTLTLKHTDEDHVIMFTDRPDRIVKYESAKKLEADWTKGNDSFKTNPPNAVLSSAGIKHPVIVVLDSMKSDGATTTFTFHSAKHNPTDTILTKDILDHAIENEPQLTNVMVTIDDWTDDVDNWFVGAGKTIAEGVVDFGDSLSTGAENARLAETANANYHCSAYNPVCKSGVERVCEIGDRSYPCPICLDKDSNDITTGNVEYSQYNNCGADWNNQFLPE
jgi:hypothetical protein